MRFEDVVQSGVLQAFAREPRWKWGRLTTPERAKQLLKYKGERVVRSMARSREELQIIFD